MEQENSTADQPDGNRPKRMPFFSAFVPKGDYFFTPIILDINFAIFFLMIATGVNPLLPTTDDLLNWGANFRPAVMNDHQYWRMFTSMFLHVGILHIASNMFALYQIGRMLEQFVGKWRFLALYLMAGLGGSAVSLWWHSNSFEVSAGASGAIFGLFGVLTALLTTDIIDQSIRKKMLRSMIFVIVLNLGIGTLSFIDNSAHIGGLLTGAIGGYLSYFDLKSWYYKRIKKYTGLIIAGFFTAGLIFFLWLITPKTGSPTEMIDKINKEDSNAIKYFDKALGDASITPEEIKKNIIDPYKSCLVLADSLLDMSLPDKVHQSIEENQTYYQMRLEAAEFLSRSRNENKPEFLDSAIKRNNEAELIIKVINDSLKKNK